MAAACRCFFGSASCIYVVHCCSYLHSKLDKRLLMSHPPNQSPEPTAVAAAVAILAASRRWLSFFR